MEENDIKPEHKNKFSNCTFSLDEKQLEEISDFDVESEIKCECKFKVISKRINENIPLEINGTRSTEVKKPIISITLELQDINILNKSGERKRAEEMGISVEKYRELKLKHNK